MTIAAYGNYFTYLKVTFKVIISRVELKQLIFYLDQNKSKIQFI